MVIFLVLFVMRLLMRGGFGGNVARRT